MSTCINQVRDTGDTEVRYTVSPSRILQPGGKGKEIPKDSVFSDCWCSAQVASRKVSGLGELTGHLRWNGS